MLVGKNIIGGISTMAFIENLFLYIGGAFLLVVFGYILIRAGSAAYFKSKKDFMKDSSNNPQHDNEG